MRRGMEPSFIEIEGVFVGIYLGADHTAEHEWGIEELKQLFGIGGSEPGIARRKVSRANQDKDLFFVETKLSTMLIGTPHAYEKDFKERLQRGSAGLFRELFIDRSWDKKAKPDPLAAAWSGSDFGIMVSPENAPKLRELYDAFLRLDVAIFIGSNGGNPFRNGGLTLVIVSKVPESGLKTMVDFDLGVERLKKASDTTGIIAKLAKTYEDKSWHDRGGCRYCACSPRFLRQGEQEALAMQGRVTKHDVIYWLNPLDQDRINFGWFTVEELEQWIEGKGPIPKEVTKANG